MKNAQVLPLVDSDLPDSRIDVFSAEMSPRVTARTFFKPKALLAKFIVVSYERTVVDLRSSEPVH